MIFEDFVFGVSWFAAVERENLRVISCHFKSGLVLPQVGKEGSDWRELLRAQQQQQLPLAWHQDVALPSYKIPVSFKAN